MTEFSLIERFCQNIGWPRPSTDIGVGDDAAVMQIPAGQRLTVSVDTMVSGVHFYPDAKPQDIAHKLAAVNLSDMAAMGAEPKWATLALTMPKHDDVWLSAFSAELDQILTTYKVQLVGGDTCQGALVLSMQIMGCLPNDRALSRDAAKVGDDVYVSGTLGDAALALALIQQKVDLKLSNQHYAQLKQQLDRPLPQISLGRGLINHANACIDISDGLVADLGHVARASDVCIEIDVDQVPLSTNYQHYMSEGGNLDYALSGGEDYQLAFTASADNAVHIEAFAKQQAIAIQRVGRVIAKKRVNEKPKTASVSLTQHNKPFELSKNAGYQHFSTN